MLTHASYDEIGGVERALASYAENVYTNLPENYQKHTKWIFTQLIHPGIGTDDTRRIATRHEIGDNYWELVIRLANERLVVTSRAQESEETAEIVHEALIKGWDRLQKWMNIDREFRLWQERLRTAIRQWEQNTSDAGALLRGGLLREAERYLEEFRERLNFQEILYIERSIELRRQELETQNRILREKEQLKRRNNQRIFLSSVVFVGLLIIIIWYWNTSKANERANLNLMYERRISELTLTSLFLADAVAASIDLEDKESVALSVESTANKMRAAVFRICVVNSRTELLHLSIYAGSNTLVNKEKLPVEEALITKVLQGHETIFATVLFSNGTNEIIIYSASPIPSPIDHREVIGTIVIGGFLEGEPEAIAKLQKLLRLTQDSPIKYSYDSSQ